MPAKKNTTTDKKQQKGFTGHRKPAATEENGTKAKDQEKLSNTLIQGLEIHLALMSKKRG